MAELGRWTRAARAGMARDTGHGAVVPPIHLSSNYVFSSPESPGPYDYSRSGNPTRDILNDALADLEGGAGATNVATGMAAITLVVEALVPVGGRVILAHDAYGGTWRLFTALAAKGRFTVELVDLTDSEATAGALAAPTDLVWIETPSNPLLRITDIAAVSDLGHRAGAQVAVDNTFCSPLLQQPLVLGADFVIHSTTKFINGHSDVVGGVAIARTQEHHELLRHWANTLGLTASPFDAYLTMRGLRTLDARLRVHRENAEALADLLEAHPSVAAVHYPGLASHPDHELAGRQMSGPGSVISLELSGGRPAVNRFLDGLQVFHLAESLGGVESLVCHPKTMTHASMTPAAQAAAGITDGLLRLSVGVEGRDDLLAVTREALGRLG
ncbi:cystathionine gamma-synthase [Tessaracoccus rhinocerotis]|uniref:homocysteine desulfhydrase n=1 Tax=Tessaracoccus rhinocerotis TaxID=1689449 RepID=A0A553K5Z3_9ACTN|nr:cystathionine gamma-synthase [Tessaracoccus rhinocerotis]TRY20125.1 cystathionine gamma-synthase [Tessaracoccus rhinocerotis]